MFKRIFLFVAVLSLIPTITHAERCFGVNVRYGYTCNFNLNIAGGVTYQNCYKAQRSTPPIVLKQRGFPERYFDECWSAQKYVNTVQKEAARKLEEARIILDHVESMEGSQRVAYELQKASQQFTYQRQRYTSTARFEGLIYYPESGRYKEFTTSDKQYYLQKKREIVQQLKNTSPEQALIEGVLKNIFQK